MCHHVRGQVVSTCFSFKYQLGSSGKGATRIITAEFPGEKGTMPSLTAEFPCGKVAMQIFSACGKGAMEIFNALFPGRNGAMRRAPLGLFSATSDGLHGNGLG